MWIGVLSFFLIVSHANATHSFNLILSGGDSPFGNHYSQYLQTKLLTDQMRTRLGNDQVDVFFGAGNSEKTQTLFPDVSKKVSSSEPDKKRDLLFPGVIQGNRAAFKGSIQNYLNQDLPSKLDANKNLFLFVTDHGMPNKSVNKGENPYSNNCINLWSMNLSSLETVPEDESCLSVSELKTHLSKLSAKKKVFAMTQCFSGGFHETSVTQGRDGYWTADPNVCGFTAITEDETASGCTADVDGDTYKGYERYLAQALTGYDVVTGKKIGEPAKRLREAHYAAALIDPTKDIPLSTSEYFVRQWGRLIEDDSFVPRTSVIRADLAKKIFRLVGEQAFSRGEIIKSAGIYSTWVKNQYEYLDRSFQMLKKVSPKLESIQNLNARELVQVANSIGSERYKLQVRAQQLQKEFKQKYDEYVVKPWFENSLSSSFPNNAADRWQTFLNSTQENNSAYQRKLIEESLQNPAMADLLADQKTLRFSKMMAFAKAYHQGANQAVIEELKCLDEELRNNFEQDDDLERQAENARRLLIIVRNIASLSTLIAMDDQQALKDFRNLLKCEATPF